MGAVARHGVAIEMAVLKRGVFRSQYDVAQKDEVTVFERRAIDCADHGNIDVE